MLSPEQIVALANTSYPPEQLAQLEYNTRRAALENTMDSKIMRPTLWAMACSLLLFLFIPAVVAVSITGTITLFGLIVWGMGTPLLATIKAQRGTPQLHALITNIETIVEQQGTDFEMTTTLSIEYSSQVVEKRWLVKMALRLLLVSRFVMNKPSNNCACGKLVHRKGSHSSSSQIV